jgi:glycosyltransferase involved in cell wall biosynthesis
MFHKVKEFFSDNFIINYLSFIYYFIIVKLSLNNSDLCISVSITTQMDTKNLFDIDSIVIPEGVNTSLFNSDFNRETLFQFPKNSFFLYVGNGRKHKNLKLLIEAFRLYKGNKKLIIIGNVNSVFLNIPNIIQIDFIPDESLSLYYKNCAAFIFPSLYEGFGLPILEAISHSAVVFSSKYGSLSEFKFNSIHFFDPNEVLELLDLMNSSDGFKFVNSDMILLNSYNWDNNFKLFHDILNQKLALI